MITQTTFTNNSQKADNVQVPEPPHREITSLLLTSDTPEGTLVRDKFYRKGRVETINSVAIVICWGDAREETQYYWERDAKHLAEFSLYEEPKIKFGLEKIWEKHDNLLELEKELSHAKWQPWQCRN